MKYELRQDLTLKNYFSPKTSKNSSETCFTHMLKTIVFRMETCPTKTPITMSAGSDTFVASKVKELDKFKINNQCLHTNSGNLVETYIETQSYQSTEPFS